MKILVFGRTGQVATELAHDPRVVSLGREQADLNNPEACAALIAATDASAVINAAAYTAVDRAEEEQALAHAINATAPGAMAQAAAKRALPFLHVSTDYVFDGSGTAPRSPSDPVSPLNTYGRTKLAGEVAVRNAGGPHAILRTSWVFSAHGANFVKTMLALSQTRDALNVVDDQIGGPTPARGIAQALLAMADAMVQGQAGGTYHYAGAPSTSWAGFARETFRQAGKSVSVSGISTSDWPTPAVRPLNSRLDCTSLAADFGIAPADWKSALNDVITELETT